MNRIAHILLLAAASSAWPLSSAAQTFESVGTRATGLGGAFVAVADDASAAYWNPAGFESGSYFSLVLDAGNAKVEPVSGGSGADRSAFVLALGAPMLGLSYYRLRTSGVVELPTESPEDGRNGPVAGLFRLTNLVTHTLGATLVQTITPKIAVGSTLKLVRGLPAVAIEPGTDADAMLEKAGSLNGPASTDFDADIGVMTSLGPLKAGLTVRNVTEPTFDMGNGVGVRLKRLARAGVSFHAPSGLLLATDFDLVSGETPAGEESRGVSVGGEMRVLRRAFARAGAEFKSGSPAVESTSFSIGGSYAILGYLLVDGRVTTGSDRAAKGWGISGRFVY
jgi:hypothetical protein